MGTRRGTTVSGALACVAAVAAALAAFGASPPVAAAQIDDCPNAELRVGASAGLPDCRAFELVSPPDKVGGHGVGLPYKGPVTAGRAGVAALAGNRFAVEGHWGTTFSDGAYSYASDWALTDRDPLAGWRRRPMMNRTAYGSQDYRFVIMQAAAEDLSLMAWTSNGGTLKLFPEMAGWGSADVTPTLVRDWEAGRWDLFGPTLLTSGQTPGGRWPLAAWAASRDGRFVVASGVTRGLEGPADPTLVPGALATAAGSIYLFDLSAGVSDQFPTLADDRRVLVNKCTAGTEVPAVTAGVPATLTAQACAAGSLTSSRGAALARHTSDGIFAPNIDNAVSADGSRVAFMSPNPFVGNPAPSAPGSCSGTGAATLCPSQIFVRQRSAGGAVSVRWVSRPAVAGQSANLLSRVFYEGGSADGSRVFFRTTAPLTGDDPNAGCVARQGAPLPCTADPDGAQSVSSDLFMYELPGGPDGDPATPDGDPAGGVLSRVSAGPTGTGDCNVLLNGNTAHQSLVPPAALRYLSDDGSRVYFTCQEPLPGVAGAPANSHPGNTPGSGADFTNLYLYQRGAGGVESWRFVARLPAAESTPGGGEVAACASTASSKGTPLNADAGVSSGVGMRAQNCFRGTRDGSFVTFWTPGRLTDESPVPDPDATSVDVYAYDAVGDELSRVTAPDPDAEGESYVCNLGDTVIAPAPCFGDGGFGGDLSQPLLRLGVVEHPGDPGSRIVVFQSKSRLTVEDTDDVYDVYVWRDGELSLLSVGDSPTDGVMYVGNDRAGENVYVATLDRLTWEDHDAALDVYAARIDGGFAKPPDPPVCSLLAHTCRGGGPAPGPGIVAATANAGPPDAASGPRARLAVGRLSFGARRRAARSGVLALRVRTTTAGVLRLGARARIGGGTVKVAGARRRLARPGAGVVRMRLNRRARRILSHGGVLRLRVRVAQSGARTRAATVRLERGDR